MIMDLDTDVLSQLDPQLVGQELSRARKRKS
jgi:hypothetical protein